MTATQTSEELRKIGRRAFYEARRAEDAERARASAATDAAKETIEIAAWGLMSLGLDSDDLGGQEFAAGWLEGLRQLYAVLQYDDADPAGYLARAAFNEAIAARAAQIEQRRAQMERRP